MRMDAWKESIKKLDDRFGDYLLAIRCRQCSHQRLVEPAALAQLVGWAAAIADVMERMRCSKCHARGSDWTIERRPKPRGRQER